MRAYRNLALTALLAVALVGCSSSDEEDDDYLPELPTIEAKFKPSIRWQEQIGDGVEHYFSRLKPVLHDNTVYAASRIGIVTAMDFSSGKEKWSVDLRDDSGGFFTAKLSQRISGGLTLAYGKLYLGTEHGEVIALDANNGDILWRKKVHGEVIAPPASGEGLLVVNTSAGYLVALHPDTGEKRWEYEQEVPPLTLRGISTPVVDSGGVIFGSANGKLNVIIAQSGLEAWQQSVATPVGASELERLVDVDTQPIVNGNTIYSLAYNGNLIAVDMQSGKIKWKKEYSSYTDIALSGLSLYLTDVSGYVYGVNINDGSMLWKQTTLGRRGLTGVYADGDQVVVGDGEGFIHWLDKENGQLVSRLELDSSGFFVSAIGDKNHIVVISRDGELSAIDTP